MYLSNPSMKHQLIRAKSNNSSKLSKTIGKRYEVLERIGAGVLGTWYKVRRTDDRAILVAKEISIHNDDSDSKVQGELTVTDGCLGQFNKVNRMKEAVILSQLKHRNLIKLHDYFTENGNIYLVTEYWEKGDISEYMSKAKSLTNAKIWKFVIEIVLGLKYLHENNIVHWDLKPQNIFVSSENKIKIGDFSSAMVCKDNHHYSLNNGTPCYIAPEIYK
jgi:serine/threonine protein kinase